MQDKMVSVVVGSYNRRRFLEPMLESVRREVHGLSHEIIVVDGGSSDGSVRWLAAQRDVLTIIQHNRGTWRRKPIVRRSWGYFMNLGFKTAQGKYVCMLSDDCLVVPGAIRNGIAQAERLMGAGRKIGAVAFFWRNWPKQERYWVGRTFGGKLFVNHGLFLTEALQATGFADEDSYDFYHADGDLGLRLAQAGYECVAADDSFVEHFASANEGVRASNLAVQKRDWERYVAKWSVLDANRRPDELGDWIYREYEDPHRTAEQFRKILYVRLLNVRDSLQDRARAMKGAVKRHFRRPTA